MTTVLVLAGILAWGQGSTCAHAQADAQPNARNRVMQLEQTGTGVWTQPNRTNAEVVRVTLGGNPAGRLGVNFGLAGSGKRALGTRLVRKDSNSLELHIVDGGNADSSGTLYIELSEKHAISAIVGRGMLDGQPFAAQFVAGSPLRIDQNSGGWGDWTPAGGEPIGVYRVGYLEDSASNAQLFLFLGDGGVGWLEGRANPVEGKHMVRVTVTKSVTSNASGEFEVMLGKTNQIISINGTGEVDGKSVRASFVASGRPLPARVELIDSSLAQLKLVRGTWTQGDASSKYAAYVNDAWVERIDVEMSQGDYGSSRRHLYFARDRLIFYSESGMRRRADSSSAGSMDEVTLQLAFDAHGNLSSLFKAVNGRAARVEKSEMSGAEKYAEALRQAAEEVAGDAAKQD